MIISYRYDRESGKRYKTAEIIVEEKPWDPKAAISLHSINKNPSERLGIRVDVGEQDLRARVKQAGGIWRPQQKLWELSYAQIVFLGLEERIVEV
jgi:hypothetical protein